MKHTLPLLAISLFAVACTPAPVPPDGGNGPSNGKASLETYRNDDVGYSIDIPSDWTTTEGDVVTTDAYQATGTSFAYPADRDRSALTEAKVNVAEMPACPAQDGGTMEEIGGHSFMRTDFDGVGAGNRYRGQTYATERGDSCLVITLYTHSCNLGPDCGPDRQGPYSYDDTLFKLRWTLNSLVLR
jgi:hypothetical protein